MSEEINKQCECENCGKSVISESVKVVQLICEKVKNVSLCEECHNVMFYDTNELS